MLREARRMRRCDTRGTVLGNVACEEDVTGKRGTHLFSQIRTPALFVVMYAGRFSSSSCSAGSFTCAT